MDGAIYLLSRKVQGNEGETLTQNVTVFADSSSEAQAIVEQQFARLRKAGERPYQTTPRWQVEKIALDQHKLITAGITG